MRDLSYLHPENAWQKALDVLHRVREYDPGQVCDQLTVLAAEKPCQTAQLIIALAAMVPLDDTTRVLRARADALAGVDRHLKETA